MATISDRITETFNGQNPTSTTVSGSRSIGGTTLTCTSLAGWPINTAVHFATYRKDGTGAKVAGSQTDWKGIVSGSSINTLTRQGGASDGGNGVGDIVEMMPTYSWANDLAKGLENTLNQDGTIKTGLTIPSPTLTSPTLNTPISNTPTLNSPTFGGTPATGTLSYIALTNPYKFSVYRNAAWTTGGSFTVPMPCDTKIFDTGNNVDITTNKGRFTAPINGFYFFSGSFTVTFLAGGNAFGAVILKNGAQTSGGTEVVQGSTGGFAALATASALLQLVATDYVELGAYSGGAGTTGSASNGFQGFLVSAT